MLESVKRAAATFLIGLVVVLTVMLFNAFGREELAQSRQRTAEANLETEKSEHARTRDAVASQKREAEQKLRSLNASVLATQNRLDASRQKAEAADVKHGRTLVSLRADLQHLRASERLRQLAEAGSAGGRGAGGAAGQGPGGAVADGGGRDATASARSLPDPATGARDLEAEADDDAFDADRINVAYAACRRDAIDLRAALAEP